MKNYTTDEGTECPTCFYFVYEHVSHCQCPDTTSDDLLLDMALDG